VTILSLPPEVLLRISSYCDYAAALALSLTCKDLRVFRPHGYGMIDLLQIERWPCYDPAGQAEDHVRQPLAGRDYFACSLCLHIRSAMEFSNAMMKGKRGKHSQAICDDFGARLKRFCIECGIEHGKYQSGTVMQFGGAPLSDLDREIGGGQGLVCRRCRSFSRFPYYGEVGMAKLCVSCSRQLRKQ
ncbi:uncharacterized protein A1O5_03617, partial [Cladophialophora psammophila CBS 110553]